MQGASIFHLARGLHRREFFSTRDILGAAWKQVYFRVVGVEDPEHVAEARASALSFIAGHTVGELESLGEEIFDERMAHRIWPGTRALAQLHLDQGQRVWLVTAAPIEIATIIARRLGLTGALGTVAEHVDGVYTGELVGDFLHGSAKGVAVQELADRFGLDLERCSAYSDSYNDLPLLSAVGNPCAINPDTPPARPRPGPRLADPRLPDRPQGSPGGRVRGGRGGRRGRARSRPERRSGAGSAEAPTPDAPGRMRGGWHGSRSGSQRRYCRVASSDLEGSRYPSAWTHMVGHDLQRGLDALRRALAEVLEPPTPRRHRRTPYAAPRRHPPRALAADADQRAGSHDAGPALGSRTTTPHWPPPRSRTRPRAAG